ncbi:MAG: hypothetical protein NXI24_18565 [bacterium]|nr:hypothetical protein [bacterium]
MHVVELIAVEDGHWAAHCEGVQAGSLSRTRSGAIASLQKIIQNPDRSPRHPEFQSREDKVYPLTKPGHYSF